MAVQPKGFWPLVISATNNKIDFNRGGVKVASVTVGTYYSAKQLCVAVVAALEAADAPPVWACNVSAAGIITISSDLAFTLLFATGANLASEISAILGYTATDKGSATSQVAEYQHQNGWYADRPIALDTYELAEYTRAQTVAVSGQVKSLQYAKRYRRRLAFRFLKNSKLWIRDEAAAAFTVNQAIERLVDGGYDRFRWWKDQADLGNGNNPTVTGAEILAGVEDLALDVGTFKVMPYDRVAPGTPKYALDLPCRRFV